MKIKTFYPKSRQEWRDWLQKNHQKEAKVTVIIYKKHTGKHFIAPQEYMDEAICFGWIDTTVKRLDDERYQRNFVKRTKARLLAGFFVLIAFREILLSEPNN